MKPETTTMRYDIFDTPIGPLLLAADADALVRVGLPRGEQPYPAEPTWQRDPAAMTEYRRAFEAWFAGNSLDFELPLHPQGTDFQRSVWWALADIPYAQTISYAELARRIGRPRAVRAVGAANGANPLPLVLPCHRVIGADGSLTGYGGGLPAKRWLLDHERRHAPAPKLALQG